MAKRKSRHLAFKHQAGLPQEALVLVFDLEGFSRFFSQPDIQEYVAVFLSKIFEAVDTCITGGDRYWHKEDSGYTFRRPDHVKFLGDGALYIWTFSRGEKEKNKKEIMMLTNRLWNLKIFFSDVLENCSDSVPVTDLPQKIRFGLASGSVYRIYYSNGGAEEYIGYSINLASRLQNYCKELGFIASARITFSKTQLDENKYKKVIAYALAGFPAEVVIVDKEEYEGLDSSIKKNLFREI